jgi:hypothetical protein
MIFETICNSWRNCQRVLEISSQSSTTRSIGCLFEDELFSLRSESSNNWLEIEHSSTRSVTIRILQEQGYQASNATIVGCTPWTHSSMIALTNLFLTSRFVLGRFGRWHLTVDRLIESVRQCFTGLKKWITDYESERQFSQKPKFNIKFLVLRNSFLAPTPTNIRS